MANRLSFALLLSLLTVSLSYRVSEHSQATMLIRMIHNTTNPNLSSMTGSNNASNTTPSTNQTNPASNTTTIIVLQNTGNQTTATVINNSQSPAGNQTTTTNQTLGNPQSANFTAIWNSFITSALQNNTTPSHNQTQQTEGPHREGAYVPKQVILDAFNTEFKAKGGYNAMKIYHQTLLKASMQLLFESLSKDAMHLNYHYPGYEAQQIANAAFIKAGGKEAYENAFAYAYGVARNSTGQAINQ